MKYLIIALTLLSLNAHAEDVPAFMKDAEITVKTRDGKEYKFSGNEYKVVKRGNTAAVKTIPFIVSAPNCSDHEVQVAQRDETRSSHKNIISVEAVRSQYGFDYSATGSTHTVSTQYRLGVGLQYQRNIHKDLYLGGRLDSNSGAAVNLGLGF